MQCTLARAKLTRRGILRALRLIGSTGVAVSLGLGDFMQVAAQQAQRGMPQPDEKVDETINRLFGNRSIAPADGKVKLEAPLIAENGAVVPVTVEAELPMTPQEYVKNIYIILTFRASFREKMRFELSSWDEHNNYSNPRTRRRHTSHPCAPQEHARG